MREFDRLPAELRAWLASAVLPWRPKSVQRTYAQVLARTHSAEDAIAELDRIQMRLIAKDVRRVWGEDHPAAAMDLLR